MKIPRNWSQVTLGQFMEYRLGSELIPVMCGMTSQDVNKLTEEQRTRIEDRLAFIETEEPEGRYTRTFWHNGKRWAVDDNINKITGGQFIDVSALLKDADSNTHKLLAVICRPMRFGLFKRKYDPELLDRHADDLLSLPLPKALAVSAFFLSSLEVYLESIPDYLEAIAKRSLEKHLKDAGDGTSPSTTSQTTTAQSGVSSPAWRSSSS
jgi:hypothetical protein